jgi:hypothetical protein
MINGTLERHVGKETRVCTKNVYKLLVGKLVRNRPLLRWRTWFKLAQDFVERRIFMFTVSSLVHWLIRTEKKKTVRNVYRNMTHCAQFINECIDLIRKLKKNIYEYIYVYVCVCEYGPRYPVHSGPRFLTDTIVSLCPATEVIIILLSNYVVSRIFACFVYFVRLRLFLQEKDKWLWVFGNKTPKTIIWLRAQEK